MYRKLMFLISLVALLVLANGTFAAEIKWDGGGVGDSFCTPENWEGDVVPGPGDRAEMEWRADGENHCVIDCAVVVNDFRVPRGGDPCLTIVDFVSGGSVLAGNVDVGDDASFQWNFSGTTSFITTDGEAKVADGGDTEVWWNISDDAYVEFAGKVRMGDGDGQTVHFNMSGGTMNIGPGEYWRLGDDGGGDVTISGGSINVFGEGNDGRIRFICRKATQIITVTGGEQWCNGEYEIGGSTGGNNSSAFCLMNMSGGIINAGSVRVGGGKTDTTLNVSGGLMIARGEFSVRDSDDGTVEVNLTGGVIQAGSIRIDDSVMDINDTGTLILEGNQLGTVSDLVGLGKLTGCGGPRGIIADYGVTNSGKTTVTATCNFDKCQAWAPSPADGAAEVQSVVTDVNIAWEEGDCLGFRGRNSVYFGDDFDDVTDADTNSPEWLGFFQFRGGDAFVNVGNLPLWENRYWRIDEFNGIEDVDPVTPGNTWTFTTGCAAILGDINMDCLVNFLDYAELANTFGEEEMWPE
jgi:hypothetical protein